MTHFPRDANAPPLVALTNPIDPKAREQLERVAYVQLAADSGEFSIESLARRASIIVVRSPIPAKLLETAPKLLGLIRYGAGVDMIPVLEASLYGVAVTNAPNANFRSVAEYVLGQMVSLARKLATADSMLRSKGWAEARSFSSDGIELEGKTLSIVGMGRVGTHLAHICQAAFNMRVLGVRRSNAAIAATGVVQETLDEALKQADILVLACPLTQDTRGLINADQLQKMKPTAQLINVSRGPVIEEAALIDALSNGRLAGAALDVFNDEPLPIDSPLLKAPNVLLTPHVAGVTHESLARIGEVVVQQTLTLLNGKLPEHLVNHEAKMAIQARLDRLVNTAQKKSGST